MVIMRTAGMEASRPGFAVQHIRNTQNGTESPAKEGMKSTGNFQSGASLSDSTAARGLARPLLGSYGLAVAFVAAASVPTLLLHYLFPFRILILFYAAVMASAWVGGIGPGLLAVVLSTLTVACFRVPPVYAFSFTLFDLEYFSVFVLLASFGSWVSSTQRKNRDSLRAALQELDGRVMERTAELEHANAKLLDRERQLRLLTEVIPHQIWSAGPDGSVDYCNERLLDYVGRSMEETCAGLFLETIHPDDRARFAESWQGALSSGTPFEFEPRFRGSDGQFRHFLTRAVPLRNPSGRIIRWYGTNTDIEERKRVEQTLARMRGEIAHLSRVLTIGELTTSIAHELNQPLAAMVNYANACQKWLVHDPPDVEEGLRAAQSIINEGSHAGATLRRIRALVRKEPPATEVLDLNELTQELAAFLHDETKRRGIDLRTDCAPHLPRVEGDRVQLQQVLLNLVLNSFDAMAETTHRPKEILVATSKEETGEARVRVEDSGIGLSTEVSDKIFQPFFTTKLHGIGMGLSISRSIIESHRGRLWASPREPGGVVFQFALPSIPSNHHG